MATKYLDKTGLSYFWGKIKAWCNNLFALDSAVVHKTGNEDISGTKNFTANPVLNQVGLSMTVKDTDADTLRTGQVLHANSPNSRYGINIAFGSGSNCVVGSGEAGTAQLSDLNGVGGENLYLVSDGNIYFKSNGNTWANAITLSYTNGGNLSFANSNITRGTNPSSNIVRAFQWNDSAANRLAVISNVYYTDSSSITALYAYNTTAATGDNIGRLGIGCDSSGNVYTEAPTPATADSSTKIATTAFVKAQGYLTSHQTLPSLSLTTSGSGNAITELSVSNHAITATKGITFLTSHQSLADYAKLASPTFTGIPNAPTATVGTNTPQIATTAFVNATVNDYLPLTGGIMTGDIRITGNSKRFTIKNDTYTTSFQIGSNGVTRGIYDTTLNTWMIYADTSAVYLNGNASTATKLATPRSLKTKLDSTTAITFDGSSAQDAIPVTGVLSIANGGTGSSTQNFVDLSNNQTVGGVKFYTNNALLKHNLAKGTIPNSTSYKSIIFLDNIATPSSYSSSNMFGQIRSVVASNGSSYIDLMGFKNEANATVDSRLTVGYDANGIAFATAPATSSSRTTSTDIVTRGYLGSTPIAGAVTGTASSTVWRSCVVGRNDSGVSNPWYKVASRSCNSASSSYNITFYVENITTTNKSFGILRVNASTGSNKKISNSKFTWLANEGFAVEDFVLVCPTNESPTVELWTKIATAYQRRRFVVISEGSGNSTSILWTLFDAVSAGQEASIPTAGTQVVSSPSSLEQRVKALEDAMQ